jgi:transglutaminase-like putative cysteine protease
MQTDIFCYHGYTELWLDGGWVKATPAFNIELCERFGVKALEFDGREDALMHEFDTSGRPHMQYLTDHGPRADLPYAEMEAAYRKHYPCLLAAHDELSGDMATEMEQERRGG